VFRIFDPAADVPVLDGLASWSCFARFFYDSVGLLAELQRRYGAMVVVRERIPFRRSARQCVVVSGADLTRLVFGDPETFPSGAVVIRGPNGSALNELRRGLVTVNGQRHHEQRRMASPLFMPQALREYYPRMVEIVRAQLDSWPLGTTIDLFPRIGRTVLLVSSEYLLPDEDRAETVRLADATNEVMRRAFDYGVLVFPVNVYGTPYRRLLKRAEALHRQTLRLIDSRPRKTDEPATFLDRLVSAHQADPKRVTRGSLTGQLAVMFAASHETAPKAVTWSLFLLAQHPRILAELHNEIKACCGDEPPSLEALRSLPLLDAVTKEAIRLLPPVPMGLRGVRRETTLGPVTVRPGDYLVVSHYATHRDPAVFPEPDQFRPERWFGFTPDPFAYVPFGAGPRTCIAKSLGAATINLIVAMIVQRYRLTIAPHSRIDRSHRVSMAPKHGMPMVVHLQDGRFEAVPITGNVRQMVDLTRPDATIHNDILRLPAAAEPKRRAA
jgi:cytochrome P450